MRVHDQTDDVATTGSTEPDPAADGADTSTATTERLISAAEHLFAIHGIDGVSLREINPATPRRCSTTSATATGCCAP